MSAELQVHAILPHPIPHPTPGTHLIVNQPDTIKYSIVIDSHSSTAVAFVFSFSNWQIMHPYFSRLHRIKSGHKLILPFRSKNVNKTGSRTENRGRL